MRRGEEEFARVRRSARLLGCIMIDLDEFKRVNDTSGHAAGDRILIAVAERLQSSIRQYDVVGRYGGEEFMVLLPDATFEQIVMVATRICQLIQNTPFELEGGELIPVTISLGVACYSKSDYSLGDLIKRADDGLYKAKADGRNRVAWVFQPGAGDTPE
jgi:diguanylate cyclase (GGDEF)-like protein